VLTEQATRHGDEQPSYYVRDLGRFEDQDPVGTIQDLLADEEQYAGHVTLVVMGGQKVADRFAKAGLSAVAVDVGSSGGSSDTLRVTEQTLVDTFEAVYRHRTVEMPNEQDELSAVLAALYIAMSDDAGADEASPQMAALAREVTSSPAPAHQLVSRRSAVMPRTGQRRWPRRCRPPRAATDSKTIATLASPPSVNTGISPSRLPYRSGTGSSTRTVSR
jgi:hypothetical protein